METGVIGGGVISNWISIDCHWIMNHGWVYYKRSTHVIIMYTIDGGRHGQIEDDLFLFSVPSCSFQVMNSLHLVLENVV